MELRLPHLILPPTANTTPGKKEDSNQGQDDADRRIYHKLTRVEHRREGNQDERWDKNDLLIPIIPTQCGALQQNQQSKKRWQVIIVT